MEPDRSIALCFTWDEYKELLKTTIYKDAFNKEGILDSLDYRISRGYLDFCTADEEKEALEKLYGLDFIDVCTSSKRICFVINGGKSSEQCL